MGGVGCMGGVRGVGLLNSGRQELSLSLLEEQLLLGREEGGELGGEEDAVGGCEGQRDEMHQDMKESQQREQGATFQEWMCSLNCYQNLSLNLHTPTQRLSSGQACCFTECFPTVDTTFL